MQQEVFVLQGSRLKEMILEKAHMSNMSFQPGETKMYHDFKKNFLWYGMKRNVIRYVARCLTYEKAKVEQK